MEDRSEEVIQTMIPQMSWGKMEAQESLMHLSEFWEERASENFQNQGKIAAHSSRDLTDPKLNE